MRCFLSFLFLLLWVPVPAQDVVHVSDARNVVNLAFEAEYIEDSACRLSIQQIMPSENLLPWQKLGKYAANFGITSSAFWLKTKLLNATGAPLLVRLNLHALNDVMLYETRGNRIVKQYHSGDWVPFENRVIRSTDFLFPLAVPQDSSVTVYLRVKHNRGTEFTLFGGTLVAFYHDEVESNLFHGIYYGFMLLMILYNLFIYFTLRDPSYLYYVAYVFLMGLLNAAINGHAFHYFWPSAPKLNNYEDIIAALVGMAGVLFAGNFLGIRKNAPLFYRFFGVLFFAYIGVIGVVLTKHFSLGTYLVESISLLLVFCFFVAAYIVLYKGYQPAKFFLIAWTFLLLSVIVFILQDFNVFPYNQFTANSLEIGSGLESLLLSIALADRINVYKLEKQQAQTATLKSLEENRKLITEQNAMLEKRVEERTIELKRANRELVSALRNLKETQDKLVQKEKMASLGELTAGIAHEIQNPLNFVNNFSEVSTELTDEIKSEISNGHLEKVINLAGDLKNNLERILYHGKRADTIVKSMLEHSRMSSGKKECVDLNALVDEYLRLAYHGLRAKDKTFTAVLETSFDNAVGNVEVVPQDIGRVLLNLLNNSFYSLKEKKQTFRGFYEPTVAVSTRKADDKVEILIKDNGTGIPTAILHKIYQPFFTTKPAGEGTGLGLSLSYDIITKRHEGELNVQTEEGKGTTFSILLPLTQTPKNVM